MGAVLDLPVNQSGPNILKKGWICCADYLAGKYIQNGLLDFFLFPGFLREKN